MVRYIQLNLKIDITPGFAKDIGKAIKDGHEKGIFELPSGGLIRWPTSSLSY